MPTYAYLHKLARSGPAFYLHLILYVKQFGELATSKIFTSKKREPLYIPLSRVVTRLTRIGVRSPSSSKKPLANAAVVI
ncbi:hypothetical protein PsorP6_009537 [Peronosclerospora sorghi]|uniref:Uncharacterized protein n=1 Tax=Peronosclerospora sorghi TaxID=230839 RepID=A0ACC0W2Y8_9STRA|nr:hypothetical protein PsorP6_009537 [Peronosclerospora sorghi]